MSQEKKRTQRAAGCGGAPSFAQLLRLERDEFNAAIERGTIPRADTKGHVPLWSKDLINATLDAWRNGEPRSPLSFPAAAKPAGTAKPPALRDGAFGALREPPASPPPPPPPATQSAAARRPGIGAALPSGLQRFADNMKLPGKRAGADAAAAANPPKAAAGMIRGRDFAQRLGWTVAKFNGAVASGLLPAPAERDAAGNGYWSEKTVNATVGRHQRTGRR